MILDKNSLPKNWNQTLNTVGCYLVCKDKFLMLQRVEHKSQPNLWQLPGGKIDKNETPLQAIQREVHEETGLYFPQEKFMFLDTVYARYEGEYDFTYHMFKVVLSEKPEVILSPNEHQKYNWVTSEESLLLPLLKDQGGAIMKVLHLL